MDRDYRWHDMTQAGEKPPEDEGKDILVMWSMWGEPENEGSLQLGLAYFGTPRIGAESCWMIGNMTRLVPFGKKVRAWKYIEPFIPSGGGKG